METKLENSTPKPNSEITGTLKLDEATNILYAEFDFPVASSHFIVEQNHRPELFKEDGYFGLAFRYFDRINQTTDNNEVFEMPVKLEFSNIYEWEDGNNVRIMAMNENEDNIFRNLRPYFEDRIAKFKNDRDITDEMLKTHNEGWNNRKPPYLNVGIYNTGNNNLGILTPKLTKKDFILSITKK